jgi:hypothetical protein
MTKAIVTGVFEGGLKEPYNRRLPPEFVSDVLADARERNAILLQNSYLVDECLDQFRAEGHRRVQLSGIWQGRCIGMGAAIAIKRDFDVTVPKRLVRPLSPTQMGFDDVVRYHSNGGLDFIYHEDEEAYHLSPKVDAMVVGMCPGLLRDPINKGIDPELAKRVMEASRRDQAAEFEDFHEDGSAGEYVRMLAMIGRKRVKVYGVWEDFCVTDLAIYALKQGLDVTIDTSLTQPLLKEDSSLLSELEYLVGEQSDLSASCTFHDYDRSCDLVRLAGEQIFTSE